MPHSRRHITKGRLEGLNEDLERLFKQSSSVNFISGKRGSGKTDFGLLLLQNGKEKGLFDRIGCNVTTYNDSTIDYLCYFDRFEDWLRLPGKKAFLLDEMGKHLYKMSFMSTMAKMILGVCQLVRKFDAHLIGVAPSADFVNKMFFNTDILDSHMVKLSLKTCVIQNYATQRSYMIKTIPRTKVKFLTKDIARFELKDPTKGKELFDAMSSEEKALLLYAKHHTTRKVAQVMQISHTHVQTLLKKAIGNKLSTVEAGK